MAGIQIFGEDRRKTEKQINYADVNEFGELKVELQPVISTVNSTSSILAPSAEFTGTAEEINGCGIIYVNVYSDVASATDGLKIEQSSDSTNWDHSDEFTIPATTGKNFSINPFAKYLRVRYINSLSAQSEFRLQTIFKSTGLASSHRISDSIIDDDDAELVKAVITGKDPDGHYHNVNITHDGDLTISDNSDGLAIAQGNVTGKTFVHKFGYAPDFDTGDGDVTVWDGAEDGTAWELMKYVYSSSADIDSISSDNNSDTHEIVITGLDEDWNSVTQSVTLSGQTRVALTTPLIRVFRGYNNNSIASLGHIFVYKNGALTGGVPDNNSDIRLVIHPGAEQTEMAVYTVPAGKTAYIRSFYMSQAGASKSTNYTFKLYTRSFGKIFRLKHRASLGQNGNPYHHTYMEPEGPFPEKTDIEFRVAVEAVGVTAASASGGFDIVLVDN